MLFVLIRCDKAIDKAIDTSTIYFKQLWTAFSPENLMEKSWQCIAALKTCVITYDGDYTDLQDDINILFKTAFLRRTL